MNEIRNVLKTAASRLNVSAFLDRLHWVAIVAAGIALALMIADRVPAQAFVPWLWVGPALAGLAAVIAIVWWRQRRATEQHVAVVVDERLDLREKLSTALCVLGRDDAFAQAAIEDAVNAARDPRTQELVRRRFKVEPPRLWWISPLLILCAMLTSIVPQMDLFRKDAPAQSDILQAKMQAEEAVDAIVNTIKQSPELEKELSAMIGEMSREGTDPNAPFKKPEDIKRDALKKATDIQKKLEEITNGEKGKTAEAMEQALNQLQKPQEDGDAKELADALAKGDFAKAQEAIKDLMAKAEKGQLSPEEKKAAAEALENIAKQLEEMAKQQEKLQDALKQAGLDPNLANNPQAMQQAIQNAQNLNEQQKQELKQMAQAQAAAAQMCQGMAGACQNMAAGLNGQQGKAGQGQAQAGQMLGEMEALQQLLQQAKMAQGQCQGACQGLGQGLAMGNKQGMGMGQRGQGRGGKAPIAPTPTGTKETKADVNTVEGDIIAKTLFEGQQVRGESKAKLVAVVEEARQGFDEGQQDEATHRKYQEAQQHYFGELEKLTKAMSDDAKAAEKKPEAAPQGDGASEGDAAPKGDAKPAPASGG
jgi:hypothetical protein